MSKRRSKRRKSARRAAKKSRVKRGKRNTKRTPAAPAVPHRYKVDLLPPAAQAAVFRGLARADSLPRIAASVRKAGGSISRHALSRFRQKAWTQPRYRLKRARANLVILKEALQINPNSAAAKIAEELLYTIVCDRMDLEAKPDYPLLREAREQKKVLGRTTGDADSGEPPAALSEEELDNRLREIYGLPSLPGERSRHHAAR